MHAPVNYARNLLNALNEERLSRKMTVKEIAERSGICRETVSAYLMGGNVAKQPKTYVFNIVVQILHAMDLKFNVTKKVKKNAK